MQTEFNFQNESCAGKCSFVCNAIDVFLLWGFFRCSKCNFIQFTEIRMCKRLTAHLFIPINLASN